MKTRYSGLIAGGERPADGVLGLAAGESEGPDTRITVRPASELQSYREYRAPTILGEQRAIGFVAKRASGRAARDGSCGRERTLRALAGRCRLVGSAGTCAIVSRWRRRTEFLPIQDRELAAVGD
jgi:hypothetical protein